MDLFSCDLEDERPQFVISRADKGSKATPVKATRSSIADAPMVVASPLQTPQPKSTKGNAHRNAAPAPGPRRPDEWWTTRMVCDYLKISRKTLWDRRRRAPIQFPRPVNLGGGRNVYRASEVQAWADLMAFSQLATQLDGGP